MIARESGGNVHARNGQYYGIGQLSAQARPTDYVVKAGDTLNKLSSEYNTTVEDIAAKNNITDVNLIFVGQHLTFAEAAASQATAAPAQAPVAQISMFAYYI
ncbi:LysM peptidoglycan-binding domain-containing protein|uniref:LysM peptidoglycan-binding domain-containing protein n=1 Tax=Leuconostoc lactis TaxID=1246 RepID=A0A6L7A8T6_LEULA|nr:LysM peptidoglycan-binding domain-containing protein [Leuconostoc lactis]